MNLENLNLDELRQLKTDLQKAGTVKAEDLTITIEKQRIERHGKITSQQLFKAEHSGGDVFNLLLEEVLANQEEALLKAIKALAIEKWNLAKDLFIQRQEAEIAKLKGEG